MTSSLVQRLVVAVVAGASILTAPTFGRTTPQEIANEKPCLPPPNCQTPKQCCAFKHDSLLRFEMANARAMRDWFGDQCNGVKYPTGHDLSVAADAAAKATTAAMALATGVTAADQAMHNKAVNDLKHRDPTTDPEWCDTKFPPGFDRLDVCKEILDAERVHESEHRDFCEAMRTPAMRSAYGSVFSTQAQAEDERRGHAIQYLNLVQKYEKARRRCLSSKQLLTPELERKSKQSVRRAYHSYLHGSRCE